MAILDGPRTLRAGMRRGGAAAVVCWAISCSGAIDGGKSDPGSREPEAPPASATPGGPAPAAPGPPGSQPALFALPKGHVKLLPFSVRLSRIAEVTGLPVDDPLYDTLRANRLSLGDSDYANAKPPLEGWSAALLGTWVESVRPLCRAPSVIARLSPMPGKLPALIEAAYGRAALPDDTAILAESLSGLELAPERVAETVCVSVLSSLEFVAQ